MFEEVDEAALTSPSIYDAMAAPDGVAVWGTSAPPCGEAIELLSLLDPATLSDAGRVDLLAALERQASWLAAVQQRALAALDAAADDAVTDTDRDVAERFTREQVGAALRLSPFTAERRLAVARQLATRLTDTAGLLARGEISYQHAARLAEAVEHLDAEVAAAVEQRVLPRAVTQTVGQFAKSVARAVLAADPGTAQARHEEAVEKRRVAITPMPEGMAELWAWLPAEGATLIGCVLDSLASVKSPGEQRTCDQRRADVLVDVFARVLSDPDLPEQQGQRPAIQVTVPVSTLLGVDDAPAELEGYGPITAAVARRLAADSTGTWRRLVTDPLSGTLLDYGRCTYRPPANLRDFVIARDQQCTFPGCTRKARRCDLDHGVAWPGGGTNACNLAPLCRRHHRAKHLAGWRWQRQPDGAYRWISPTGHEYVERPPPYPPDG
jgi:Domain of unknown function (DUF222)